MQNAKCKGQNAHLTDWPTTAPWPNLRRRAELLRELREFFHRRGFLEVETPILSADIVVDRHLDPFSTVLADDPRRPDVGRRLWLQTSPEFAMKRLLAGAGQLDGAGAIYQVARVFRNGERGRLHNPEFTMVEWYRVGDDLAAGMTLLSDLADALLRLGPAERVSYQDAFLRWAGVDPLGVDTAALAAVAADRGVTAPVGLSLEDRDAWLELLFGELVQPNLGQAVGRIFNPSARVADSLRESQQLAERVAHLEERVAHQARQAADVDGRIDNPSYKPAIVYDFPASQAALAKVRPLSSPAAGSSRAAATAVAERFELFVAGVELANGYHELLDPAELRRRSAAANAQRAADGKPRLPEENRLLAAMEHGLPACSGVALGFDRLVMLAVGAQSIDEVIAFPIDRA
jgi:lysyl-tRNA synthetase class 2